MVLLYHHENWFEICPVVQSFISTEAVIVSYLKVRERPNVPVHLETAPATLRVNSGISR